MQIMGLSRIPSSFFFFFIPGSSVLLMKFNRTLMAACNINRNEDFWTFSRSFINQFIMGSENLFQQKNAQVIQDITKMLSCTCTSLLMGLDSIFKETFTCGAPSISSITRQLGLGSDSNTDFIWVAASSFVLKTSALLSSLTSQRHTKSQTSNKSSPVDLKNKMKSMFTFTISVWLSSSQIHLCD